MQRRDALLRLSPGLATLLAACASGGAPESGAARSTTAPSSTSSASAPASAPSPAATPIPAYPVFSFSNSSPHIVQIDPATNRIARTKDVPNLGVWATNDDNCYFDGKHAWLGARNPANDDVEVMLLDLDTLEITRRIPLGKDRTTVYIGKGSRLNQLFVAKHASGQMSVIDTKTFQVLETKDVPVNGGVACDMDVATGPDGIERAFIPTDTGDTTISINTATREVIGTYTHTKGVRPYMLTASPDGRYVWVQERTTDGQSVLDARTMQLVKHVPSGKSAFLNSFSPGGKLSYIGHNADNRVVVIDAVTFAHVKDIEVGTNAKDIAPQPNGKSIYAIATRENLIAVIDTSNWAITARITLPENPEYCYCRGPLS